MVYQTDVQIIKTIKNNFEPMGCTSTAVIEQRRILPLPPETVNSFIDKFPALVLHKIRQKFYAIADKESKDLTHLDFLKLYSTSKIHSQTVNRLFYFFNDYRKQNLKFKQFMSKYATITKCEPNTLFKIFFYVHKYDSNFQLMSREEIQNFVRIQRQYFQKVPQIAQTHINQQKFVQQMSGTGFNVAQYQSKLLITTQDDVPFQAITRELQDCEFNDFSTNKEYYLLSHAWFNRWSFYYQQANHTLDKSHIKSTKMLFSNEKSVNQIKRRKKRENLNDSKRLNQSNLKSSELGNALIQQPNTINFQDIQGQYRGQLKQSLKVSAQIKVITKALWQLLCSLHPPEQYFKRIALNQDTIQYYPKSVYYAQANHNGQIIISSQKVKQLSLTQQIGNLYEQNLDVKKSNKLGAFTKNFFQKNWRQIQLNKHGVDISLDPRFFVIFAEDRQNFLGKNYRKEVTAKTLDIGDKVYTYFPYVKQVSQAAIISKCQDNKFKIHFKGYSFKYQLEVSIQELQIVEADASLSAKKKTESILKGIPNIGNTCFMNSIIQCLIATPVLDQFLQQFPFEPKKHPLGYALSVMAKSLLKNQKCSAQGFKKIIDTHMPLFSGFDQHDAQQFLNLLLDKLSEQLQEKPTVIDYLFGGKAQSKLTCLSCQKGKVIDEKMYILSLPLPETQFNFYSIIIVPVTSKTIKKAIFKLHKDATVTDYINSFQQRTGQNKKDYVFCQSMNNSLKKLKVELTLPGYQRKKVTDLGIVPNISLIAFEKLPAKVMYDLLKLKKQDQFKDYQSSQTFWTVCKVLQKKDDSKDKITLQILNQQNELEKIKVDKDLPQNSFVKLGNQTMQPSYKKIILRKYNSSLKKLQHFGMEFLIGIPRWASYNDIISLTQRFITNLKGEEAKLMKKNQKGAYVIRLLDPTKVRCIFCLKQNPMFDIDESELEYCCDAFEKDIPLGWSCKYKSYWIYVDWIKFNTCNYTFTSFIEIDTISKNVELSRQEQFINLQDCIKLYNQNQKVEMQCDSCKFKQQNLQHLIGTMPNILVVHMKEFRYTSQGHLIKLDLRLKWLQYLDASKFAFTSQGKLYELFAIVKHSGTSHSGHYTCIAKRKHPFQNKKVWINFDDDYTDLVKQQLKYIDDSYLLFYKKVDMPTSSLVIYTDLSER